MHTNLKCAINHAQARANDRRLSMYLVQQSDSIRILNFRPGGVPVMCVVRPNITPTSNVVKSLNYDNREKISVWA